MRARSVAFGRVGGYAGAAIAVMVVTGLKKNRQAVGAGGFSGDLGANLTQSLRQWLGKAIKTEPEGVHASHFNYFQSGFKHESCSLGKHGPPPGSYATRRN
jgi:hypothetical protein